MTIGATPRKRDKLAAQLTWLANRDILNLPEDRRHDRIVPRNPIAVLTLEDGTKMTCRIIDLSLSGAAIAAENRPPLKSTVFLGRVQGRVVRNLEDGFALEFMVVPIFNSMIRIDKSLIEAAYDAGATGLQTLVNVIIPLAKPGIVIGSIFVITIVMGDFITIGVMGGQQIAAAGKIIETRLNALQFPAAAANAVILLAITFLIITMNCQRIWGRQAPENPALARALKAPSR